MVHSKATCKRLLAAKTRQTYAHAQTSKRADGRRQATYANVAGGGGVAKRQATGREAAAEEDTEENLVIIIIM